MTKSNLGGEGLLQLMADSLSLKEDEAGTDAETAEQRAFPAHSLWLSRPSSVWIALLPVGWALLHQLAIKKTHMPTCPQAKLASSLLKWLQVPVTLTTDADNVTTPHLRVLQCRVEQCGVGTRHMHYPTIIPIFWRLVIILMTIWVLCSQTRLFKE